MPQLFVKKRYQQSLNTNKMTFRNKIFIFLFALLFSYSINELNLNYEQNNNKERNTTSTTYGFTCYSIDNSFYLPQIKNMVNGFGYTTDPQNEELKVRRTPLYPLFYGIHYLLFGEKYSFAIIRYSQILLFGLASVLLAMSVYNFSNDKSWSLTVGYLYAFSPFIASYCYFTITEALSPSLVVFAIYFFSKYFSKKKSKYLLITGVLVGLAFLNRPLTGLLLPALVASISLPLTGLHKASNLKALSVKWLLIASGFLISISPWVIRNYMVTDGEIIFAEKIYYNNPAYFGKAHQAFRNYITCFNNTANNKLSPEVFGNTLLENIKKDSSIKNSDVINRYINTLPPRAFHGIEKEYLRQALNDLNNCFWEMEKIKLSNPKVSMKELFNLPCEESVEKKFNIIIQNYKTASPIQYYIITPLRTTAEIIFQSNSSNIAALNPEKRNFTFYQTIIKSLMYLLNTSLWLSAIFFIVLASKYHHLRILILVFILALLLSLTLILFRHVESRYLLLAYPLMYISLGYFVTKFIKI